MPLRGSGLALGATGVHELLVNVNGTPAGRDRARLAAVRMLLPVLGLPGAAPARLPADPAPITVLYPIAEPPHRIATVPGAPPLLDNDSLAASFATTGRLGGMVAALAQRAPVGSPVRTGLCLAIDPDLVETASVMSQGYQVVGRGGVPAAGTGAAVAGQWLAQLAAVAKGGCVVALPYADADLVALSRGGLTDAAARALSPGRQILVDAAADPRARRHRLARRRHARQPDARHRGRPPARGRCCSRADAVSGRPAAAWCRSPDGRSPALLTDPLLTRAATAPPATPAAPGPGAAATAESLAGDDGPLATQDLLGAVAFRAGGDRPVVVAPPHQWRTDGAGARALLDAVGALVTAGQVTPSRLADAAGDTAAPTPVRPDPPVDAAEVPAAAVGTLADVGTRPHRPAQRGRREQRRHHGRPAVHAPAVRAAARGVGRQPGVAPGRARRRRGGAGAGGRDPQLDPRAGAAQPVRARQLRRAAPGHGGERAARHRAGAGASSRARPGCGSRRSTSSRSRRSAAARCR